MDPRRKKITGLSIKLRKYFFNLTTLLFLLIIAPGIKAQAAASDNNDAEWGLTPIPILFSTPETGIGLGGMVVYYYNPDKNNSKLKKDVIRFALYGTQKDQYEFFSDGELYFKTNDYKVPFDLVVRKYPGLYFGTGPHPLKEDGEKFTPYEGLFQGALQKRVIDNLYIGPLYYFSYYQLLDSSESELLRASNLKGSEESRVSGAGIQVTWDTRDSSTYTRNGVYADIKTYHSSSLTGSTHDYGTLEFDLRYFFQIKGDHVIALQGILWLNWGDVPFNELEELGGTNMLRGIYQGKYRDKKYAAAQMEYRFPLFWRLGGVVFAGTGQVSQDMKGLFEEGYLFAAGGGLRININKEAHMNIRIDYGISELELNEYNSGLYINILETF